MTQLQTDVRQLVWDEVQTVMQTVLATWPLPVGSDLMQQMLARHGFDDEFFRGRELGGPGIERQGETWQADLALGVELRRELNHAENVRRATHITREFFASPAAQMVMTVGVPLPDRLNPLLWLDVGLFGRSNLYGARPVPALPPEWQSWFAAETWRTGSPYESLGRAESLRLRPLDGVALWHVADVMVSGVELMWFAIEADGSLYQALMRGPSNSKLPVEIDLLPT